MREGASGENMTNFSFDAFVSILEINDMIEFQIVGASSPWLTIAG
jgi:hypothetical protein